MSTQRRNTKRALKALLFVGGILILALIGAVVYFYAIGDSTKEDDQKSQITCGCYLIDPAVVNDCGDPKKAILFTTKTVATDQVCNAQCDTDLLSEYVLKSTTETNRYKSCTVRSISDARCKDMILTDQDGKLITGKVSPEDQINVKATFDSESYSDYVFKVNSQTEQPDDIDGGVISKKISDFGDANALEIVATATDSKGDNINSIICRRVIEVEQQSGVGANAIAASTERQSDGRTKISQVVISVGQITSENVKVSFAFGSNYPTLIAQDGFTVEGARGTITMTKANLYNTQNFQGAQSFSVLDNHQGSLSITAEVFVDDSSIGVVRTEVQFANIEEPILDDQDDEEPVEEESNFATTKNAAPFCVERVDGSNEATFTITVQNNAGQEESITSIKDKLPLGFEYVAESSTINGAVVTDSEVVTVTTVGSTEEIVWQPTTPWNIAASGQMTIIFKARAGSEALTGDNLNEVIVNPVQIPADPATLRAEAGIIVAQDCDNPPSGGSTPSTGILDNIVVRLLLGAILFITAWIVYTRPEGSKLSEMIVDSDLYKDAELAKYKVTNPKKYFEEKVLRGKKG